MKLRAKDTFHTSGLGVVHKRAEFEVHDELGKEIVAKGLATVIEGSTDTDAGADQSTPAAKKAGPKAKPKADAPEAEGKALPPLSNKSLSAPSAKGA